MMEPAVGASVWASGSQEWNGKMGTLMAKAMEEAQKEQRSGPGEGRPPGDQVGQGERAVGDAHVEDGQQHQQRGGHRVQEELDRRVDPPFLPRPRCRSGSTSAPG
jgi:hypothetical protein